MKKIFSFLILIFILNLSFVSIAKSEDGYMFGGLKIFNYGVDKSDLQAINTSLIYLGFSSSSSSTDNTGVGFDIGFGFKLDETYGIELGFVDYGTLTIKTNTTAPVENITTEINGSGVTAAAVFMSGDIEDSFFLKGGMHSWEFEGTVTASLGSSTEPLGTGTDAFFAIGGAAGGWYYSFDFYVIGDGDSRYPDSALPDPHTTAHLFIQCPTGGNS